MLYFIHIPKCGGTSVQESIRACGNFGEVKHTDIANQISLGPIFHGFKNKKIISGHFSYGVHEYLPDVPYKYATVIRHPVARVMSTYTYVQDCAEKKRLHHGIKYLKDDLVSFAKGYWYAQNLVTRQLAGIHIQDSRELNTQDFNQAKENLAKIDFVGITDNLNEFIKRLEPYGVSKTINRRNVTVANKETSVYAGVYDGLLSLNEFDMELFEIARDNCA